MNFPTITLKPRKSGSAIGRHPWVFAGAVGKVEGAPQDGGVVQVLNGDDHHFISYGVWNSKSEIRIRLYSWDPKQHLDSSWLKQKISSAISYRKKLGLLQPNQACRLIFSEGDGLSGLTVDQYADVFVVQVTSKAMEVWLKEIVEILVAQLGPKTIWLKGSSESIQKKEGLSIQDQNLYGEPLSSPVRFLENELQMEVDFLNSQKTGGFLDQQENHKTVASFSEGKKVLDLYTYMGGFAIHCSKKGAKEIVAVDSSVTALQMGKKNAELNRISNVEFLEEDSFEFMKRCTPHSYDLVISDPPKFAPSVKDKGRAFQKYFRLNVEALRLITSGGILVSCSCSGSVSPQEWVGVVASAAKKAKVHLRIMEMTGASKDHPTNPDVPESSYLKCLIAEVTSPELK